MQNILQYRHLDKVDFLKLLNFVPRQNDYFYIEIMGLHVFREFLR